MLYHIDKEEEEINKYKDLLMPYMQTHRKELLNIYNEELRITQMILQKDNIDEKFREFNTKKLKGVNYPQLMLTVVLYMNLGENFSFVLSFFKLISRSTKMYNE